MIILGISLVARGKKKGRLDRTVAEDATQTVVRTLLGLWIIGTFVGLVIYGGNFLHIEMILKLLHLYRG